MSTTAIPELIYPKDLQDATNQLIEIHDYLNWLLKHLDHLNVKQLYTEYCNIQSEDGETIIKGPVLEMYDKQATPVLRLRQGYDPVTGNFVFELYNATGGQTVYIDSNGNAVFTGSIIGSTITGGTLQTSVTGNRIVITGNSLLTYKGISGTDYLHGPAWGTSAGDPANFGDVFFYNEGTAVMQFYNTLTDGYLIKALNGKILGLGSSGTNVDALGSWSFSLADSITGLSAASGTTGPGGADNHTHSIPTRTVG